MILHVIIKLLLKTVQSVDEFVLGPTLWTQMRLMLLLILLLSILRVLTVLIREAVIKIVTTDGVTVASIDLYVLEALAAQRQMLMLLRTLQREVGRSRGFSFGMKIVLELVPVVVSQPWTAHITVVG